MAYASTKRLVAARLRRLRRTLADEGLAALVVVDPRNVHYLTGFTGEDSVLLVGAGRRLLVTDSRFTQQVRRECPGLPIMSRTGPMTEAVARGLTRWGLAQGKRGTRKGAEVGIEAAAISVAQFRAYRKVLGSGLAAVDDWVGRLRLTKDEHEVRQLRRAVRIAEEALTATLAELRVGVSEREVAARLEYEMVCRGAAEASFPSIVAFGGYAAEPHAVPRSRARLRAGQSVLFDWGACWQGYRSDLTRCFVVGRIRPDFAAAYRRVLEAQVAAIEAIKPGVALADVDAAARAALAGVAGAYGHGTGHGIGLDVHEGPALSGRSQGELREGMVVTVEPGVYLPGRFGIRIEDDVLVTARGRRVLSSLPKTLDSLAR